MRFPRLDRDSLTYLADLLLGGWRLRERIGPRKVGDPPPDGRAVLCGNWVLEVHRLEAALRQSGGGHLVVVETEGRDIWSADALGMLDGRTVARALEDLKHSPSPAPDSPPDPSDGEAILEGDAPDQSPAEEGEGQEEVRAGDKPADVPPLAAEPRPTPAPRLLLPAAIQPMVAMDELPRAGRDVRIRPSRVVQLAACVRDQPTQPDSAPLTLRERLEAAIAGAAFLTAISIIPLLFLAPLVTAIGLLLIWGAYLVAAALQLRLPRVPGPLVGAMLGIGCGLLLDLVLVALGAQLRSPGAFGIVAAGAAVGAWASRAGFQPTPPSRRDLVWSLSVSGVCLLLSGATMLLGG